MQDHRSGRVLVLRWDAPLDGTGRGHNDVARQARDHALRVVLLDATRCPYVDSDGMRWLLRLRDELESSGASLRIAARPGGKVRRNLVLLNAGLALFDSPGKAWKAPFVGRDAPGEPPRKRQ